MSAGELSADTDLINSPVLQRSQQLMKRVTDTFAADTAAATPVVRSVRGELDKQLQTNTPQQLDLVTAILEGILALTRGDVSNVSSLSQILAKGEEDNFDLAAKSSPDPHLPRH
jgi:hypothetical protein